MGRTLTAPIVFSQTNQTMSSNSVNSVAPEVITVNSNEFTVTLPEAVTRRASQKTQPKQTNDENSSQSDLGDAHEAKPTMSENAVIELEQIEVNVPIETKDIQEADP